MPNTSNTHPGNTSYKPNIGDKVFLTDHELETQSASVKIIKAIAIQGYLTVSEVFEYLPNKYVINVKEDPTETVGFINYSRYQ
jgi:hypothetical protein